MGPDRGILIHLFGPGQPLKQMISSVFIAGQGLTAKRQSTGNRFIRGLYMVASTPINVMIFIHPMCVSLHSAHVSILFQILSFYLNTPEVNIKMYSIS